ncbi:hypothetical protein FIBSPDRAFT_941005 [Athelia psychrophila]|uniref:Ricin B lectin domain-containing protein n=1 Tax=Athelia psychrophila TaxID=1759441 RepID=A0A167UXY7_9AGAM|nr:hypothetical protein FIBSPDRAFT_941005 [Fibularhizoctonia sp. CBS 109695]
MLFSFVALSSFLVAAQATALSAQRTACFTTHTGYLTSGGNDFGMGSDGMIVYPYTANNSTKIKLSLQACPQMTGYGSYNYPTQYFGRLVATETIAANQCLSVVPSASNLNILNGKLKTCGSDYLPATDQSFLYTENDFGNQLLFAGLYNCTESSGTIIDSAGNPLTATGTNLWQLQCIWDGNTSTFGLSGTWN